MKKKYENQRLKDNKSDEDEEAVAVAKRQKHKTPKIKIRKIERSSTSMGTFPKNDFI